MIEQSLARLPQQIIDRGMYFWLYIEPAFHDRKEDEDAAKPNGGWVVSYRVSARPWDHFEEGQPGESLATVLDRMYDYLAQHKFVER